MMPLAMPDWRLTPQRAAVHLPTRTAVVGDIHWGYDTARRSSGEAVPVIRSEHALAPLAALAATWDVHRLVVAGDLLEGPSAIADLDNFLSGLSQLKLELIALVPGNHDRALP